LTTVKALLQNLDLGNSVAEFDDALETYFVETESFRALVSGKVDVVAGDKGTGKTDLYRVLQNRRARWSHRGAAKRGR
jgi:ABC-type amino acid transport substrate-binding protein